MQQWQLYKGAPQRKTKRIKKSDRKAKRNRDQAEAPAQAAAAESYYRCTKKRKSADGDACQRSAPHRPRSTPDRTPRSHQTPDQTPRADQTAMGKAFSHMPPYPPRGIQAEAVIDQAHCSHAEAASALEQSRNAVDPISDAIMALRSNWSAAQYEQYGSRPQPRRPEAAAGKGTTPHHHLVDRILDSLQRSTYRFGGILALTRPELNSLFSGDHASGDLAVALGGLSSKNEVHYGVGTGGCPIVVLGPIPEVAKRESKASTKPRKQTRKVGGAELATNVQTARLQRVEAVARIREGRAHGPWTCAGDCTPSGTPGVEPDLRLPQELSQPINGTQSTEAEQHSEINKIPFNDKTICQNCQKPNCKLRGKCGKPRRNHERLVKKLLWLDRIREHHRYNDREEQGTMADILRDVLGANGIPYAEEQSRGGKVYNQAQRRLRDYLENEEKLRAAKGRSRSGHCHPTRQRTPNFPIAGYMLNRECERRFGESRYVGCRWISQQMKNLVRWTGENGGVCAAGKQWRRRWRLAYNWSLRVPSNAKNCSIEQRMPRILTYMQGFRQMISDRSLVKDYPGQWDDVYGAFPLCFRWNWDQVPLPFVLDLGPTFAPKGARRTHVKRISEALLKRQATLQILCRADGKQGRIAIIFRGTAQGIGQWELDEYKKIEEEGIDVYFQVRYTISFSCPFMSI